MRQVLSILVVSLCVVGVTYGQSSFVNWEHPHVHPLDVTPDQSKLLAVNTADNRLEIFDITSGRPVRLGSIPVGVDPVSVRARTNDEIWVANHVSDSISIVSLTSMNVTRTLTTRDEPCDIVFAGPSRAFVSCSQANVVMVFNITNLNLVPTILAIDAEDPRAMAVGFNPSSGATEVYVAVFESGNRSTILGGGQTFVPAIPPNVVSNPAGPYGGVNPPPNDGPNFRPPKKPGNPAPPAVGLIVKKDSGGLWMDDNGGNWTNLVSGASAAQSGRPVGWDLPDRDVAIINASTLAVRYATGLMNMCMAIAVNPSNNRATIVGTDGTNQIRFEPVLTGRFLRVLVNQVDPVAPTTLGQVDLNSHLVYTNAIPFVPIVQSERDKSLGDPRGIVWNAAGTRGYVTGMGSNNVIVIDANGNRAGLQPTINVGEGPTGVVLDEARNRLYVLNKFAATISAISVAEEQHLQQVPLHDPTPSAIKVGRKHLYDTHRNSGLGHISCASCHVDARMDRLAWDLGDPSGDVKVFNQNCATGGCQDWHPMKGPMTTQTLQDIIGKEPHHWRGDRNGLEEFAGAFLGLQGDDAPLSPSDMQEFENFLATIHFPPNPSRNFDNTLPTNLPLTGHFTTGRFGPAGQPMPNGNAVTGLSRYRTGGLDSPFQCVTCHTLPTGIGTNYAGVPANPLPPGPNGELHHAVMSVDGSTNVTMKVAQLRNMHEKVGFDMTQTSNSAGFGYFHDGSIDSLTRFINLPVFSVGSDQDTANIVALMLAFAGSDLPVGSPGTPQELPGPSGKDTHAAVGSQITVDGNNKNNAAVIALINSMKGQADINKVGWIAKGSQGGLQRGYQYIGGDVFQSDRSAETITTANLRLAAANGSEITFTVVSKGSERRMGIDRDLDTYFDRDELDVCANPADSAHIPGDGVAADFNCDAYVDSLDFDYFKSCKTGAEIPPVVNCTNADLDADDDVDMDDFAIWQRCYNGDLSADPGCM